MLFQLSKFEYFLSRINLEKEERSLGEIVIEYLTDFSLSNEARSQILRTISDSGVIIQASEGLDFSEFKGILKLLFYVSEFSELDLRRFLSLHKAKRIIDDQLIPAESTDSKEFSVFIDQIIKLSEEKACYGLLL